MRMNSSIILAGQQPDIMGNMLRGYQGGRQRRVDNTVAQYGAGAMQGDQNALNALAGVDPQLAQGMQRGQLQMDATRQRMEMLSRDEQRQIAAHAASVGAAQAKAEAERIKQGVFAASSAQTPEQWDGLMTQFGLTDLVGQFANKEPLLRRYMTAAQILGRETSLAEGAAGPEWIDLTPEELAERNMSSGQRNRKTGQVKGTQLRSGETITMTPGGGVTITRGGNTQTDETDVTDPTAPAAMILAIDGILGDPALDWATGFTEWTQNIPGTGAARFKSRADQLNGQAFLQAFESLKGGGHITEIEGQKATQAIGRLDTAQRGDDYRQALMELRDVLAIGMARRAQQQTPGLQEPEGQSGLRLRYNIETGQFE